MMSAHGDCSSVSLDDAVSMIHVYKYTTQQHNVHANMLHTLTHDNVNVYLCRCCMRSTLAFTTTAAV